MSESLPVVQPRAAAWPLWLVWLFGLLLGGSMLFNLLLVIMLGVVASGAPPQAPGPEHFSRQLIAGQGGRPGILLIELSGVISDQSADGLFGPEPSLLDRIGAQLNAAADDPQIVAVLLNLDTPGGGVAASEELYRAVAKLSHGGKPVLAHMGALCASGGYYVAMACDRVLAGPSTITGSIGVIMSLMNAERLVTEVLRLKPEVITSGEHKDMGSPFRSLREDERAMLQGIVNHMYERFFAVVAENRQDIPAFAGEEGLAALRGLCDGRIYHAADAAAQGLVDGIADRDQAEAEVRQLAGLPADAPLYRYQPHMQGLKALLQARVPDAAATTLRDLGQALTPRFEYRWQPGLP